MSLDGPRFQVNEVLIPTNVPPGSPIGASYEFIDATTVPGTVYHYWLAAIDLYGRNQLFGPVRARAGMPFGIGPGLIGR